MRFLVISDVHGNRFGLAGVLEHARDSFDAVICLGDVVGYGAHPNECCEILQEHNALCLLGNHDAATLGAIDTEWFNPIAKAAVFWTRDELTPENYAWLGSLQPYEEFPKYHFEAVHASLREPIEEYIANPGIAEPNLLQMKYPLCWFGHTHVAVWYRSQLKAKFWRRGDQLEYGSLLNGGPIQLEKGWRYLINPGSCGQPRDGNRQARYAIYDAKKQHIEVRAVDYDWNAARSAIIAAGLPPILGERLMQGH